MIAAGAIIGVLTLIMTLGMIFVGLPYTKPSKRSCCCGMVELGGAHFYIEPGRTRIHEERLCGPVQEWIP